MRMFASLFLLSVLLLRRASGQSSNLFSVNTSAGTVEGSQCKSSQAIAFLAIPFAEPPTGNLRFAPPQPYNSTYKDGVLRATVPAPNCIQFGTQFIEPGQSSEDCLYLDIWVPPNTTAHSGLPVKVWIYGGGNEAGSMSGPLYDGCNLAAAQTLVVSINYRVGPLGFLALESAGIDGNFGIQDILMGLRWVQENIAAFGGDPRKVLLFGQSAGATNVFTISTLPDAPSLFKAAITESGGGRDAPLKSSSNAIGQQYARSLNCSVNDVSCLRSKSTRVLNATIPASSGVSLGGVNEEGFNPYVDGEVIPMQPSEAGVKVPTIFGSNTMEGTLFLLSAYGDPRNVTEADYISFLQQGFGSLAPLVESRYPVSAFNSTPLPAFYAFETVFTDVSYRCPAYRGLQGAIQNGVAGYTYLWSHSPSCAWAPGIPQDNVATFGPTHTAEIPFVFANVFDLPLPNGTCSLTAAENRISTDLVAAWSAMAAQGNPSTPNLPWPIFSNSSSLGVNIGNSTTIGHIDHSDCAFWDAIDATQLQNTTEANAKAASNASTTAKNVNASAGPTGSPVNSPIAFTGEAARFLGASTPLIALVIFHFWVLLIQYIVRIVR